MCQRLYKVVKMVKLSIDDVCRCQISYACGVFAWDFIMWGEGVVVLCMGGKVRAWDGQKKLGFLSIPVISIFYVN